jgi:hypothetical protein
MGAGGSLPGLKWPGFEADHSYLLNVMVKNVWSCTSFPLCIFWNGS